MSDVTSESALPGVGPKLSASTKAYLKLGACAGLLAAGELLLKVGATAQPDGAAGFGGGATHSPLSLQTLSPTQSSTLLQRLMHAASLHLNGEQSVFEPSGE